jgi:hypothetical protein
MVQMASWGISSGWPKTMPDHLQCSIANYYRLHGLRVLRLVHFIEVFDVLDLKEFKSLLDQLAYRSR